MFDNFRRFGRICSVISVGSVRFGSVTGFIHSQRRDNLSCKNRNTLKSLEISERIIMTVCHV